MQYLIKLLIVNYDLLKTQNQTQKEAQSPPYSEPVLCVPSPSSYQQISEHIDIPNPQKCDIFTSFTKMRQNR